MLRVGFFVIVLFLSMNGCTNKLAAEFKDSENTEEKGYTLLNKNNFLRKEPRYYKVQFYSTGKFALEKEFDLKVPEKNYEVDEKGKLILEKSSHVKKSFIGRNTPFIIRRANKSDVLKGMLYASKLPLLAKDVYDKILERGLIKVFFSKNTYMLYSTLRPLYPNDFMADVFQEEQFIDFYIPFRASPKAINFEENQLAAESCDFYLIIGNTQSHKEELYCSNQHEIKEDYWNALRYNATIRTEKTIERSYYKGVPVQNN